MVSSKSVYINNEKFTKYNNTSTLPIKNEGFESFDLFLVTKPLNVFLMLQ